MARIRRRSPAGLTLAIVAGVPCPGKGEIRMARRIPRRGRVGGALADRHPRRLLPRHRPAVHKKDDLVPRPGVWSTHSSAAASKAMVGYQ